MRVESWAGLVTNASPFALPAGAAVEQVNLACHIPGQIQTRGGMRRVACVEPADGVLDCYPVEFAGRTYLLALKSDGSVAALESPAYGPETSLPAEPNLSVASGQRGFSYTLRYVDGAFGAITDSPPPAPPVTGTYVVVLDGGVPSTPSWPYFVDANDACEGAGKVTDIDGGSANTTFQEELQESALCEP